MPTPADYDCDDTRADMNPGLPEVCNGIDDNCDGHGISCVLHKPFDRVHFARTIARLTRR